MAPAGLAVGAQGAARGQEKRSCGETQDVKERGSWESLLLRNREAWERMNFEKRTQDTGNKDMDAYFGKMFDYLLEKLIEWLFNNSSEHEYKRKEWEEMTENLMYEMNKALNILNYEMKALLEDLKNEEVSTQYGIHLLIEELENEGMKKEKERARALESRMKTKIEELSRRIQALQEDVKQWPETIKHELQFRRGVLKNIKEMKVKDIVLTLENMLKKNKREFSQEIETLKVDAEKYMETINHELQILRDELEKKKEGKKEEEIALAQETLLKKDMSESSQKIETLKEDIEEYMGTINHELQILRDKLKEKDQGMKKEKERAWALESRLKRKVQHFSRRIQTLQKDVEELPKTIMLKLQIRRGVLKNIKENKEEDIALALETLEKKKMQEFSQKIETLKEDVEECMETIKYELQILRDELEEKDQGMKEEDIPSIPETLLNKNKREFSEKIETVKDNLEESMEIINYELQNLKYELEVENRGMKKEKERAWALESRLQRKFRQFSRRIKTLQEDVEEWPETIMLELQIRRGVLKNIKGIKKEDIALALENMLKKNKREFSQKTETLKEDVDECMETINHELHILKDELEEKKQGKM